MKKAVNKTMSKVGGDIYVIITAGTLCGLGYFLFRGGIRLIEDRFGN